jgi:hypothetical protein
VNAPLVRIRCGTGGCRRVLIEFYEPEDFEALAREVRASGDVRRARKIAVRPSDWTGRTQLDSCPRHDKSDLPFAEFARLRFARGRKLEITMRFVNHGDLRHLFYLADTLGRTQDDVLNRGSR